MLYSDRIESVLVTGDEIDCSLFQIAVHMAKNGNRVWFISAEQIDRIPESIKVPEREVLQLLTFMYLKDFTTLVTQLNGIHLWRKVPHVIILSGFEKYFTSENFNNLQTALTLTTLTDSAAVCVKRNDTKILLLVAHNNSTESTKLQILKDLYFKHYIHNESKETFVNLILDIFS